MLRSLITSIKLRFTYKVNAFIYSFKTIPVIGKLIPNSLYNCPNIKLALAIIFTILMTLIAYPLLYLIYIIFVWFIFDMTSGTIELISVDIMYFPVIFFICSTIILALKPISMKADRDSDYAINSMHMPAKTYLLSNYLYKAVILFFGFTGALLILNKITSSDSLITIPSYYAIFLAILHLAIKNIATYIHLTFIDNSTKHYICTTLLILSVLPLLFVYIYCFDLIGIVLNVYYVAFVYLGIVALMGLFTYKRYHFAFKRLFHARLAKKSLKEVELDQISNSISADTTITSNKHGYDLLHDLFVKRHSKILIKTIMTITAIETIIVIVLVILSLLVPEIKDTVNDVYENLSLYFLVIMYFINRGEKISKAMFMNCDHAMLTYRIYRSPKVILEMFKRRLKTLIGLNIIPASVLAIGSLILLIITKANLFSIIFLPISLLLISVFFSVHNLVLYYLLQPYNEGTEERSKSYRIANMVTYFVCIGPAYYFNVELSPELFSIICLTVSIIYIIVALNIVNKYAPKTFRINYE